MKTLTILRHAKSSWEYTNLADIERPILSKGKQRTLKVCKYMMNNSILPDVIYCSPATRAMQTAAIVIEELKLSLQPQINKELYPGSIRAIFEVISAFSNEYSHVMIVGHNPVLTDLIEVMGKNINLDWLPTSGLFVLEFEISDWTDIVKTKGKQLHYAIPKALNK